MAAPDRKPSRSTLGGRLTMIAIGSVVLAYIVTIVVGVASGRGR